MVTLQLIVRVKNFWRNKGRSTKDRGGRVFSQVPFLLIEGAREMPCLLSRRAFPCIGISFGNHGVEHLPVGIII